MFLLLVSQCVHICPKKNRSTNRLRLFWFIILAFYLRKSINKKEANIRFIKFSRENCHCDTVFATKLTIIDSLKTIQSDRQTDVGYSFYKVSGEIF